MIHTDKRYFSLNLGCSRITLRELCNNQRPRCDIGWLHVTNHLYHGFPSFAFDFLTVYLGKPWYAYYVDDK